MLNNGTLKDHEIFSAPFKLVEFRDSRAVPLIQVADILIGSVAYEANQHDLRRDASRGKIEVLKHIKRMFGIETFRRSTPLKEVQFTVWHFDFSKARK